MSQAELMTALWPLIDATSVGDLLLALARVANEKAEHIRECCQDGITASAWDRLATRIDRFSETTAL